MEDRLGLVHSYAMNSSTLSRRALLALVLLAAALTLSQSPYSLHAQPASEKPMMGRSMAGHDHAKMMAAHDQMMADHAKMIADLKAKDAEIATLLTQMNSATADKKVNLLADVVTKLAAQQTTLHTGMESMHQMMEKYGMSMGQGGMCPCVDDSDEKPMKTPAPQK